MEDVRRYHSHGEIDASHIRKQCEHQAVLGQTCQRIDGPFCTSHLRPLPNMILLTDFLILFFGGKISNPCLFRDSQSRNFLFGAYIHGNLEASIQSSLSRVFVDDTLLQPHSLGTHCNGFIHDLASVGRVAAFFMVCEIKIQRERAGLVCIETQVEGLGRDLILARSRHRHYRIPTGKCPPYRWVPESPPKLHTQLDHVQSHSFWHTLG
jgi:hypothetical protein